VEQQPCVIVHRERSLRGVANAKRKDPYVNELDDNLDPILDKVSDNGVCTNTDSRLELQQIVLVSVERPLGGSMVIRRDADELEFIEHGNGIEAPGSTFNLTGCAVPV